MLMARGNLTSSRPASKGRPPLRQCPDDFDVIFVEQGRVGWRRGEPMSEDETTELNRQLESLGAKARYRADGSRYFPS